MYTYYFVSMHTRDIWWKKFLTMMQLIQFTCMLSQALYLIGSGCQATPPRVTWVYFFYIISIFALFMNFYLKSYTKKGGDKQQQKSSPPEQAGACAHAPQTGQTQKQAKGTGEATFTEFCKFSLKTLAGKQK